MKYDRGTVTVTNGSQSVVGVSTLWAANVSAGQLFTVVGSGITYEVGTVVDDTHITLTSNYAGATNSALPYTVIQGFTPNQSIPYPDIGDVQTATILKRAIYKIDGIFGPYGAWNALSNFASITTTSGLAVGNLGLGGSAKTGGLALSPFGRAFDFLTNDVRQPRHPGIGKLPNGSLLCTYACGTAYPSNIYYKLWDGTNLSAEYPISTINSLGTLYFDCSLKVLKDGTALQAFDYAASVGPNDRMGLVRGTYNPATGLMDWDEPTFISTSYSSYAVAVGAVFEAADGTLYLPCWGQDIGTTYPQASVLISNDHGRTWPTQVFISTSGSSGTSGYGEGAIEQKPDGTLILILRFCDLMADQVGEFYRCTSSDGGMTWTTPALVLNKGVAGRPALIRTQSGALLLISRGSPTGSTTDNMSTYETSWDWGVTWTTPSVSLGFGDDAHYESVIALSATNYAVVSSHGAATTSISYLELFDAYGLFNGGYARLGYTEIIGSRASFFGLTINNTSSDPNASSQTTLRNDAGHVAEFWLNSSTATAYGGANAFNIWNQVLGAPICFTSNGGATADVTIKNGKTGFGTTSPAAPVHIAKAAGTTGVGLSDMYMLVGGTADDVSGGTRLIGFGWPTATNIPAYLGYVATSVAGSETGALVFGTRHGTSDVAPTEDVRIAAGNLMLGTTSVGTSGVGVLAIANGIAPSTSPTGVGQVYATSGALMYRGAGGAVTEIAPTSPRAFVRVTLSNDTSALTGYTGDYVTVPFDTKEIDVSTAFSTTTHLFMAQRTKNHRVSACAGLGGIVSATSVRVRIRKNGSTYVGNVGVLNPQGIMTSGGGIGNVVTVPLASSVVALTAGDTLELVVLGLGESTDCIKLWAYGASLSTFLEIEELP